LLCEHLAALNSKVEKAMKDMFTLVTLSPADAELDDAFKIRVLEYGAKCVEVAQRTTMKAYEAELSSVAETLALAKAELQGTAEAEARPSPAPSQLASRQSRALPLAPPSQLALQSRMPLFSWVVFQKR
jgi:hypothetical protein